MGGGKLLEERGWGGWGEVVGGKRWVGGSCWRKEGGVGGGKLLEERGWVGGGKLLEERG